MNDGIEKIMQSLDTLCVTVTNERDVLVDFIGRLKLLSEDWRFPDMSRHARPGHMSGPDRDVDDLLDELDKIIADFWDGEL